MSGHALRRRAARRRSRDTLTASVVSLARSKVHWDPIEVHSEHGDSRLHCREIMSISMCCDALQTTAGPPFASNVDIDHTIAGLSDGFAVDWACAKDRLPSRPNFQG